MCPTWSIKESKLKRRSLLNIEISKLGLLFHSPMASIWSFWICSLFFSTTCNSFLLFFLNFYRFIIRCINLSTHKLQMSLPWYLLVVKFALRSLIYDKRLLQLLLWKLNHYFPFRLLNFSLDLILFVSFVAFFQVKWLSRNLAVATLLLLR